MLDCSTGEGSDASRALGFNIAGAMAGGLLENLSLVLGYQNLMLIVGLAYGRGFELLTQRDGSAQGWLSSESCRIMLDKSLGAGPMNSSAALSQVLDAVAFAARKHQGKFRKDEKTPYASHPFRVCLIVRDLFGHDDPRMLATALLHDVIEDTDTDFDDLAEQFSPEIARWVGFLTKDKRLPEPEREKAYLEQLLGAPWQVQVCKLADIYDNLSDMRTMPAEVRAEKIGRLRHYLDGFQQSPHAELRRPLELARGQLLVVSG